MRTLAEIPTRPDGSSYFTRCLAGRRDQAIAAFAVDPTVAVSDRLWLLCQVTRALDAGLAAQLADDLRGDAWRVVDQAVDPDGRLADAYRAVFAPWPPPRFLQAHDDVLLTAAYGGGCVAYMHHLVAAERHHVASAYHHAARARDAYFEATLARLAAHVEARS